MIPDNLKSVTQRIARCCERTLRRPNDVTLVCVTKKAGIAEIKDVLALGVMNLGENRVQDLVSKYRVIGDRATWHLVGHLQTNKVKDTVAIASLIHSVDSVRLAKAIDAEARKINKIQDILIQVNVSGEATKFGLSPEGAFSCIKGISLYKNISIKGLMTIAPEVRDPEKARPYFRSLRELRDKVWGQSPPKIGTVPTSLENNRLGTVPILSMGMSNDFEAAIEEGSNMVRIGRAIFKS